MAPPRVSSGPRVDSWGHQRAARGCCGHREAPRVEVSGAPVLIVVVDSGVRGRQKTTQNADHRAPVAGRAGQFFRASIRARGDTWRRAAQLKQKLHAIPKVEPGYLVHMVSDLRLRVDPPVAAPGERHLVRRGTERLVTVRAPTECPPCAGRHARDRPGSPRQPSARQSKHVPASPVRLSRTTKPAPA